MKTIAKTLGVSRSHLMEQMRHSGSRPPHYRKAHDAELGPLIRQLADARPTYGYRRICVLLNRALAARGQSRRNHKCVYRLMRQQNLLLTRSTGRGRQPSHDGKVITLRSNLRWCSDVFEISCWNGEALRIAFVLDTCDREVISWVANTRGISGEMVRDLMVEAVEARFGPVPRTPQRIEWLSDNGSCYTAHETVGHAFALGLIPCFTPVQSPESNGMAEAFVKSFKRDYVAINDRPNAPAVLLKLKDWFEDYNAVRPHRGLRMRSPREFIQSQTQTATCPV